MTQPINPSETVPDATHVEAAVGGENVGEALSLADINKTLGRNYKDLPSALAGMVETYSFVGAKTPAPAPAAQATAPVQDPSLASKADVESLKAELFYSKHPEYEAHRNLISKMGANPSEVVALPEFKEVFEKVKVADEVSKQRSVVSSNSRLGQNKAATEQAIIVANAGGSSDSVAAALTAAVMEAYDLK
jgi:hypothetical protein